MDPWAPINGISLERYAELAADVAETQDPQTQAAIVGQKGVSRPDWEAAKSGWTARMQDMSLMGQVATRFMPMYQAALAQKSAGAPLPQLTYEDYVAICGCPPVLGIEGTLAHYRLSMVQWTQIAGHWNGVIATNPQYAQHGLRVEQEAGRIRAGGAPRPLSGGASAPGGSSAPGAPPAAAVAGPSLNAVSGAMPGAVPPPGFGAAQAPQPGYAPQPGHPAAQAPGYPQQQAWPQQQPGYAQPGYNQQAVALGNQVGNAFGAFGNALGSFVNNAITPLGPGTPVMVQWSDGQRYPGTVMVMQGGQVQVAFPDGRQVWVPQAYVTSR